MGTHAAACATCIRAAAGHVNALKTRERHKIGLRWDHEYGPNYRFRALFLNFVAVTEVRTAPAACPKCHAMPVLGACGSSATGGSRRDHMNASMPARRTGVCAQPALVAEVLHRPDLDKMTYVYNPVRAVRRFSAHLHMVRSEWGVGMQHRSRACSGIVAASCAVVWRNSGKARHVAELAGWVQQ